MLTTTRTVSAADAVVLLLFVWHGGEYVEVGRDDQPAAEVVNVYDYEAGKPAIPYTQEALDQRVDEWVADYGPAALIFAATHHWN